MKFGKVGQIALVSVIALLVATLFTACGTLTVGFLYVPFTSQTTGQIEVYEVNSEAGSLRQIPTSPFPSGGRKPVAAAPSPDFKNLYVVNNDDNNIVQFGIGTDGKLYAQSTVNTPGSFPIALAINSAGSYVYALDTLQPIAGCTQTNPCSGDVFYCPINTSGSLGTPVNGTDQCPDYLPLQVSSADSKTVVTPTAISVLPDGKHVYVTAYSASTSLSQGYIFAYSVGSDGSLTSIPLGPTPENGSAQQIPLITGTQPFNLTSDSTGANIYVVDKGTNLLSQYAVNSDGTLNPLATAKTGNQPSALTIDNDKYVFVTNSLDSTVTGYSIAPGNVTQVSSFASGVQPVAVMVDPRNFNFLYTVNFLGNNLSGYQVDLDSGKLINTKNSPYASSTQPVAIAGIPHGGTATSSTASK